MERRSPPETAQEIGKERKKKEYSRESGRRAGAPQKRERAQEIGKRRKKERKKKEYSREAGRRGGGAEPPRKGPGNWEKKEKRIIRAVRQAR